MLLLNPTHGSFFAKPMASFGCLLGGAAKFAGGDSEGQRATTAGAKPQTREVAGTAWHNMARARRLYEMFAVG